MLADEPKKPGMRMLTSRRGRPGPGGKQRMPILDTQGVCGAFVFKLQPFDIGFRSEFCCGRPNQSPVKGLEESPDKAVRASTFRRLPWQLGRPHTCVNKQHALADTHVP